MANAKTAITVKVNSYVDNTQWVRLQLQKLLDKQLEDGQLTQDDIQFLGVLLDYQRLCKTGNRFLPNPNDIANALENANSEEAETAGYDPTAGWFLSVLLPFWQNVDTQGLEQLLEVIANVRVLCVRASLVDQELKPFKQIHGEEYAAIEMAIKKHFAKT